MIPSFVFNIGYAPGRYAADAMMFRFMNEFHVADASAEKFSFEGIQCLAFFDLLPLVDSRSASSTCKALAMVSSLATVTPTFSVRLS